MGQYSKIKRSYTENYKGIEIVYLSFRCRDCGCEMAIKSNPETNFYLPLKGCTLPWLKDEEERWKSEDGNPLIKEDDNMEHTKRLEKLVEKSQREAEEDEF